ncbi:hypothetical protein PpBr36_03508 [Pyricularia pennisetigena]|uniref:hypothetical protein n=1 Tax=Pyricularia pennisetigena TaxID=1578925 RepID=UPI00115043BC|nr:hypothetical protein PpBr36_03508 [Pyricularia pennisetigena]TLS29994.1 hypothetical protein PpBr36_03508 [Pyricularia pennisetigena]
MDDHDVPETSTASKPKRPLFKKRKVKSGTKSAPDATGTTGQSDGVSTTINLDEDDDGLDLFKRSKDFFPVFVKDREEELAAETQKSEESSDRKRRKISPSADGTSPKSDLYDVSEDEKERIRMRRDEKPLTPPPTKDKSLLTSSGRRSAQCDLGKGKATASPTSATPSRRASVRPAPSSSIVISDSDDDYVPRPTASRKPPAGTKDPAASPTRTEQQATTTTPIEIDDHLEEVAPATDGPDDEDNEFAHFVVAARERRENQKAARAAAESARGTKPIEERTIQVFVTSRLPPPKMHPVVINTVMRKPIKILRDTVVAFSASRGRPLTDEEEKGAFLVWKDRRLYGSSTLMSLGVMPDAHGDFSKTGPGHANDGVTVNGQLHFELFTEEIYAEWMQQLERQRQKDLYQTISDEGEPGQNPAADGQDETQAQDVKSSEKIRIFLKAKNLDQVKASAKADTEISELVAAFRNVRKIPADKEVVIMFDGDKLAENDTVGDAGIEDRDVVDVLVK